MAAASRKNQFKVVLLGEGCVGKTSLMLRYVQDKFNDKHLTTLQVSGLRLFMRQSSLALNEIPCLVEILDQFVLSSHQFLERNTD